MRLEKLTVRKKCAVQLSSYLYMADAVISMDAMGCQTTVAQQIIKQKADDMLSLKGNQGTLHADVKLFFESETTCPEVGHECFDAGHGRYETRTVYAYQTLMGLRAWESKRKFALLRQVFRFFKANSGLFNEKKRKIGPKGRVCSRLSRFRIGSKKAHPQ